VTGVSDELYTKFIDLCEVLHISPLATSALGDILYEAYYEGHDEAMLNIAKNRKA
jgi:hypothetical protein